MQTARQLRDLIRSVLTCQGHFHAPTIQWNDDYFDTPRVRIVCDNCIKRMAEAIGVEDKYEGADVIPYQKSNNEVLPHDKE